MIDTGAQVLAITKELFDKLIDARVEMRVIPIRKFSLMGAFSEKEQTASNQIKFEMCDTKFTFDFIVVKSLAYNMILGLDLKQNFVSIDCESGDVHIRFRDRKKFSAEIYTILIDDTETAGWFELIRNAQTIDKKLIKLLDNDPNYYERDELIRIRGESGERIAIPDEIKWQLVQRVHEYLLHFGTDKCANFVQRFFEISNLERLARDVVASCKTCLATKYYIREARNILYYRKNLGR